MKLILATYRQSYLQMARLRIGGAAALFVITASLLAAQAPAPRIHSEIASSQMTALKGSLHPMALPQNDAGRMPGNTRLNGISLYFNRTAAQQAALDALVAAQQNPASPQYHQWLTPDQFAAQFGMAQSDLDRVQSWLQQQGFTVDSTARSRNMIRFSGTVSQVESAFATEMHYYQSGSEKHFAPSTALSLPAALARVVSGIRNLNDFRPRAQHIPARGAFTSSVSGSVFFAPGDIVTTYDVQPLYSAGVNGAGQTIVVAGQSAIQVSDIENFQSAAGLTKKDPNLLLVPGSGDSTVVLGGDEGESDLDVEWSGAMAPGANILFVYTGSSTSYGVFDAVTYAIDEKLAPIISLSYSTCEVALTSSDVTTLEGIFQQGAAQGQTAVTASGDQGSTACSGDTQLTTAQQETVSVNYPASSAYVTGIGGTEISAADSVSTNSTYWVAQGSSDIITSAKTYIPEVAWNDDTSGQPLSASGGGTSTFVARPSWQTGVPGIPSGSFRLVPDVAFYSSPAYPGYLYCTSDTANWNTGQTGSCGNGFRASTTDNSLTVAGGTSFATPIFAGMIAILNQKLGYTSGQGNINPTLYKLASNSATYASAFHDVTTGNNDCTAGSTYCSSTTGFSASTGYDEVTGLGSIDLNNIAGVWPANSGTAAALIGSTTTVSASSTAPTAGQSVTFTITVAPNSGSGTPTGTVNLSIDGGGTGYSTSGTTTSVTLGSNGTATYTTSFTTSGTHEVVAQYAGDSTCAASTGSAEVVIAVTSSGKGTFALAATGVTVAQGSSGASTITVTPSGGYTGTVLLSFTSNNNNALANLCYSFSNTTSSGSGSVAVPGTAAVTTQLTLDTNASDCATTTGGISKSSGVRQFRLLSNRKVASRGPTPAPAPSRVPAGFAFAGLLLAGCLARYARKLRSFAALIALAAIGLGLSACGSSSSSTTVSNPPKGTYTITLSGQDSVTATNTASTTFTFTIN
jgi:subtilase family serine protease